MVKGESTTDKIDIFVFNLGLESYWREVESEDIYFAIECKRLKGLSSSNKYIGDIKKFIERQYIFRFPFNGMIGFVEKSRKNIEDIIEDINHKIKNKKAIKTSRYIEPFAVYKDFKCSFISKHCSRSLALDSIEIYHLFFDYSKMIVD